MMSRTSEALRYQRPVRETLPIGASRFIAGWIGTAMLATTVAVVAVTILGGQNPMELTVVAILEGACLGIAQQLLVDHVSDGKSSWFVATLSGVVMGRALQYVLESGPWMAGTYLWPHSIQIVLGACAGIVVGSVMAVPQALAMRKTVGHCGAWIATHAASTATAFAVLAFAQFAIGAPQIAFPAVFCILLGAAWLAAAAAAAIEAPVMARLLHVHRQPPVR
jgi:hypothetical protein